MAETVGSSASRKRKTVETKPPIIQLSCAQLCGCAECWKTAIAHPSVRRSARLAAKKPKQAKPLSHERQTSGHSFVYDLHNIQRRLCCSPDGRYMFLFTNQMDLLIVDLWQNTHKLLKSPTEWSPNVCAFDPVAVSYEAIVLRTFVHPDSIELDEDLPVELRLFRFGKDSEKYENILLYESPREISFALTEISGRDVVLKKAVVGWCDFCPTVLLRLNIDEAEVTVDHTLNLSARSDNHVSVCNGQNVYAVSMYDPKLLSVYSPEQKKWLKDVQLDTKETEAEKAKQMRYWWGRHSLPQAMYVHMDRMGKWPLPEPLFRCDIEAKKWERVPVDARNLLHLSSIVNPVDGTEDGLVVVKADYRYGYYDIRFKVERIMFRRPDSLEHLSLIALRKSREDVEGEEGFQRKMSVRPQKRCLPRWYEGMEPIPVHDIQ